jgi:hypothetical protein
MDITAGKDGTFFVTKDDLNADIARELSEMTFKDFGHYVAWFTLQKISPQTCEQFARKNNLKPEILQNFSAFNNAVYYKETEDLISFFEKDDNFRRFKRITCLKNDRKTNFTNDFKHNVPKFNFGYIHDKFYLQNQEIPKYIKKAGIAIKRISKTHLVQYNAITHKVHLLPTFTPDAKTVNNENIIYFYENSFIFFPEDWQIIRQIDSAYAAQKATQKTSWFPLKKNKNEIIAEIIKKISPPAQAEKYLALYQKYVELSRFSTDYKSRFIYECHKMRNRILVEGRLRKLNNKKLLPEDTFTIIVENERSSHLALTFERINTYWHDRDFAKLCLAEPWLKPLENKKEAERDALLADTKYIAEQKLQYWMENSYKTEYESLYNRALTLIDLSPITKDICGTKKELNLLLSMLYSFKIYNPTLQRYQIKHINAYFDQPVDVNEQIKENLRKRYNDVSQRQTKALNFIKIRYGFSDELIKKATKIYNATLKI